jgi:hypothetical protein
MESVSDINVELAKIQNAIQAHLGLDANSLIFDYRTQDGKVRLDLVTINPRHNQSFLYHTEIGFDKLDALKKMQGYVKNAHDKESHYTIQWAARSSKELHTSYFRAGNVYEALDKLYYGRDMNTITVFSVNLNPVS